VQNIAVKDPVSGAPVGAPIDEAFASRYCFSAAEDKPGTAHGVKGMPYALNMTESNGHMVSACHVLEESALSKPEHTALCCLAFLCFGS
jgi:hypothetical protein